MTIVIGAIVRAALDWINHVISDALTKGLAEIWISSRTSVGRFQSIPGRLGLGSSGYLDAPFQCKLESWSYHCTFQQMGNAAMGLTVLKTADPRWAETCYAPTPSFRQGSKLWKLDL